MDDVPLREHVAAVADERHRAHIREHQLIDEALRNASRLRAEALEQAREQVDSRLANLNELRSEVTTDRASFVTRDLFDLRLKPLEEFRSQALGFGALVALISAAVGSVITAVLMGVLG